MQELKDAARVALTDCAGVKPGENVVVVTDEPKRMIGLAFWEVACELGAEAIFCEIVPRKSNGAEPPRAVAALLKECDVFMIPTSKSMTHTDARRASCKNGGRGATLPNIAEDTMKRALKADYGKIQKRTSQVAAAIQGAREARVITAQRSGSAWDLHQLLTWPACPAPYWTAATWTVEAAAPSSAGGVSPAGSRRRHRTSIAQKTGRGKQGRVVVYTSRILLKNWIYGIIRRTQRRG